MITTSEPWRTVVLGHGRRGQEAVGRRFAGAEAGRRGQAVVPRSANGHADPELDGQRLARRDVPERVVARVRPAGVVEAERRSGDLRIGHVDAGLAGVGDLSRAGDVVESGGQKRFEPGVEGHGGAGRKGQGVAQLVAGRGGGRQLGRQGVGRAEHRRRRGGRAAGHALGGGQAERVVEGGTGIGVAADLHPDDHDGRFADVDRAGGLARAVDEKAAHDRAHPGLSRRPARR